MKYIYVFLLFIIPNMGFAKDNSPLLDDLVATFNACREVEGGKKAYFFSRKFLAYRVEIVLNKEPSGISNSVEILRNNIAICSQPTKIESFQLDGSKDKPKLVVFYYQEKNPKKSTISLSFVREGKLWVIDAIDECCVKLNQ